MNKCVKTFLSLTVGIFIAGMSSSVFAAEETHVVSKGESFWSISQKYLLSLPALLKLNEEHNPLNLEPGTVVQLPEAEAKPVQVQAAETKPAPVQVKSVAAQSKAPVVKTPTGQNLPVERVIPAKATAYSADASQNGGYAGMDYFGNPLKVGSIAVDPKVIPLGSTVYITGYKTNGLPASGMIARAVDVGGAIKGSKVDIFVPGDHAEDFGIQNVKVYVLKK